MDGMFSPEIRAISHSDFRIRIPASPPTFARVDHGARFGQAGASRSALRRAHALSFDERAMTDTFR